MTFAATLQLPLTEGVYRTRNGRIVELIGRYPNSWYGRFNNVPPRTGKMDGKRRIWYLDGTCGSAKHSSWNLVEKVTA